MSQYPATTLISARQTIRNGMAEVLHLTHGDLPQAFGMARRYCLDMAEACRVCEIELAYHGEMTAADLNPAEDAALDEMAARDADAMPCRGVDPFFATALNTVRPNWEAV